MKNLAFKIAYNSTYALLWCLSLLPFKVMYIISDCFLYPIVNYLVGYRKRTIRANLKSSFPNMSDKERKNIEKKFYHFFCDYIVENIKLFSISKKEMMKRMTFGNLQSIYDGYNEDKSKNIVYMMLGHYGNWEWIASLQYWMPDSHCSQIYHPLYNKVADKMFNKIREQYGGECIPMKQTLRRLIEMKRQDNIVVLGCISDQLPKWNSIHHFTWFLNRDTAVFTGTEQMARKLDGMVYYGRVTRPKRGYYHMEAIKMTYQPKNTSEFQITDDYMKLLEEDINANPHLWLWSHKRWKRTKEQWEERQKEEQDKHKDK